MADIRRDGRDGACHDEDGDDGEGGEEDIQPEVPDRWRTAKAGEHGRTANVKDDEGEDASVAQSVAARIQLGGWAAADACDDNAGAASCEDRPDGAGGEEDIRAWYYTANFRPYLPCGFPSWLMYRHKQLLAAAPTMLALKNLVTMEVCDGRDDRGFGL